MYSAKIAVVEDEPGLRLDLVEFLCSRGFDVTGVEDAAGLYRLMAAERLDLVLLDIRLPGESGLEVARCLYQREDIRVVMLTSQSSDEDRVNGLNAGADAYLDKQTSLHVIEATCRSILRRAAAPLPVHPAQPVRVSPADTSQVPRQSAEWQLDTLTWILTAPNGHPLKLTHAEYSFLAILIRQPGQSVSRQAILTEIGKADTVINRRNLDSAARRIRTKILSQTGWEIPLESSYGVGYVFHGTACCTGNRTGTPTLF